MIIYSCTFDSPIKFHGHQLRIQLHDNGNVVIRRLDTNETWTWSIEDEPRDDLCNFIPEHIYSALLNAWIEVENQQGADVEKISEPKALRDFYDRCVRLERTPIDDNKE